MPLAQMVRGRLFQRRLRESLDRQGGHSVLFEDDGLRLRYRADGAAGGRVSNRLPVWIVTKEVRTCYDVIQPAHAMYIRHLPTLPGNSVQLRARLRGAGDPCSIQLLSIEVFYPSMRSRRAASIESATSAQEPLALCNESVFQRAITLTTLSRRNRDRILI